MADLVAHWGFCRFIGKSEVQSLHEFADRFYRFAKWFESSVVIWYCLLRSSIIFCHLYHLLSAGIIWCHLALSVVTWFRLVLSGMFHRWKSTKDTTRSKCGSHAPAPWRWQSASTAGRSVQPLRLDETRPCQGSGKKRLRVSGTD